ncbi:stage II sporulation protein P [Aneurinibacillus sp. Ricciae_BoGa-3]|uniref:stage II sporulation protein P n=1 Tax=Aneurinibacillus sp. Ricciae_BoGa-3 TaxID=3022697 RepID=UPI0023421EBE|nr:stage II sporulation protein P [Aneurinibacillus sp. Ricciae_BoGa-3]WCK53500.1 stage II sporulation protein P [Aneurinibacillus sp. Ricciae_BoGa-3]
MRGKYQGFVVNLNGANVERIFIVLSLGTAVMFILVGLLFASKAGKGLASEQVSKLSVSMSSGILSHALEYEIPYFNSGAKDELSNKNLASFAFELVTGVNPDDARTFLGHELPGFDLFDTTVLVAGKDVGLTDIPVESSPPPEVLKGNAVPATPSPPIMTTKGKKVVFLYNTHDRESFLPELPISYTHNEPNRAMSTQINVTNISRRIAQSLEKRGLGAEYSTVDYTGILERENRPYSLSYAESLKTLKQVLASNHDVRYLIDIHRDSLRRGSTTATINGKTYARVNFVMGMQNKNWELNEKLALKINDCIEKKYPGISKGIFGKNRGDAEYNQSVSPNVILIEVGGVDNTMEECYRTADAIADAVATVYWDAEKANGKSTPK